MTQLGSVRRRARGGVSEQTRNSPEKCAARPHVRESGIVNFTIFKDNVVEDHVVKSDRIEYGADVMHVVEASVVENLFFIHFVYRN